MFSSPSREHPVNADSSRRRIIAQLVVGETLSETRRLAGEKPSPALSSSASSDAWSITSQARPNARRACL